MRDVAIEEPDDVINDLRGRAILEVESKETFDAREWLSSVRLDHDEGSTIRVSGTFERWLKVSSIIARLRGRAGLLVWIFHGVPLYSTSAAMLKRSCGAFSRLFDRSVIAPRSAAGADGCPVAARGAKAHQRPGN